MLGSASALVALPPFAGFYSKDMIIEAARESTLPGATYAYYCVLIGAFVTSLYSFRALFLTFHTSERMDNHTRDHLKESPWVVWLPLVLLAIPSVILGFLFIEPMLFAEQTLLGKSIFVLPDHNVVGELGKHYHGPWQMILHALGHTPFWLVVAGFVIALVCYQLVPSLSESLAIRLNILHRVLLNKFGFDDINDLVFVRGTKALGQLFFGFGDRRLIDGLLVNGTGLSVRWLALKGRMLQSGYLYHYAGAMVLGLLISLSWFLLGR